MDGESKGSPSSAWGTPGGLRGGGGRAPFPERSTKGPCRLPGTAGPKVWGTGTSSQPMAWLPQSNPWASAGELPFKKLSLRASYSGFPRGRRPSLHSLMGCPWNKSLIAPWTLLIMFLFWLEWRKSKETVGHNHFSGSSSFSLKEMNRLSFNVNSICVISGRPDVVFCNLAQNTDHAFIVWINQ